MEKIQLSDGLNLTVINTQKFNSECFTITFIRPISSINPSAFAMIPYVLLSGCEKFPNIELLNQKLDTLYGAKIEPVVRKKGDFLTISFVCDIINSSFTSGENLLFEIYDILLEILYNPLVLNNAFSKSIVESEKNNLINRINGIKNDKRTYASSKMIEIMCKNEPFGINALGTCDLALKIDENSLYEDYLDFIKNSSVELFYCGNSSIKDLDFSKISAKNVVEFDNSPVEYTPITREIIENLDISQGKLSMGFRTNTIATDDDYPALCVFNTIFGGSTSSKLFENVREKLSLCYYASSNIEKIKGIMTVNSGVEVRNFNTAKTEILKQFTSVQDGDFTIDEINSAKLTLINNLKSVKDSKYSLQDFYLGLSICDLDSDIDFLINSIDKVSKQEIINVSKKVKLDTIFFLKGDDSNE